MLGKTFLKKINLKYYFFPPKPKEDILIARDILYAPTVPAKIFFPFQYVAHKSCGTIPLFLSQMYLQIPQPKMHKITVHFLYFLGKCVRS